uniref:WH1 domain-containing protein n=1 Tax=Heterorhabditis bacteriophora TaxID=37862 RepID=A0A1I7XRY5_HETBA
MTILHDRAGDRRKKRPPNTGSKVLETQENQMLFSILGQDNVSLSAAVVELLTVEGRQWKLMFRGVLSLVKDYPNRAYFMRLYDILSGREMWSFRLYKGFKSIGYGNCPHLLTFEDESHRLVFGLNFVSAEESKDFKGHLDKRHEAESKSSEYLRYSRGCLSFPDANFLPFHNSPMPVRNRYEYEQYDNVSPHIPSFRYSYSPMNDHYRDPNSSGSTSSSEYQDVFHYNESQFAKLSNYSRINDQSIYYYQDEHVEPELPSPDYSPPTRKNRVRFHLPDSCISRSESIGASLRSKILCTTSLLADEKEVSRCSCPDKFHITSHVYRGGKISINVNNDNLQHINDSTGIYCCFSPDYELKNSTKIEPQFTKSLPSESQLMRNKKLINQAVSKDSLRGSSSITPFGVSSIYGTSSIRTPIQSGFSSGGVTPIGTMVHTEKNSPSESGSRIFSRKERKKKEKKPRIRKEDISNPTNFQLVLVISFSIFWLCLSRNIIRAAGQDPSNMSKKTMKFVYDFIENYKDDDAIT